MPATKLLKALHEVESSVGLFKKNDEDFAKLYVQLLETQSTVDSLVKRMGSQLIRKNARTFLPDMKKKLSIRASHFVSVTRMTPKDEKIAAEMASLKGENLAVPDVELQREISKVQAG